MGRCAVCATRDIPNSPPALFCSTCEEYFCQRCFSEVSPTCVVFRLLEDCGIAVEGRKWLDEFHKFSAYSVVFCTWQFHVTTRLKAHTTQQILNSFTSLDSRKIARVDQERLKKDGGPPLVHGVLQKPNSDMAQLNHTSINGQESDNRQVHC